MIGSFTWVDVVLVLSVFMSAVAGLRTGLARVVVGFVAAIVGLVAGFWMYRIVAAAIQPWLHSEALSNFCGFSLIFCGVLVVGAAISALLSRVFKWVGLSWFNHLLGGFAGGLRGAVVTAAVLSFALAFLPSPLPDSVRTSRLLPYFTEISAALVSLAPRELKDAVMERAENLRQAWQQRRRERDDSTAEPHRPLL